MEEVVVGRGAKVVETVCGDRRDGTSGIMTVGLGSQIYRNKSIYLILNICHIFAQKLD
jgi:hypothetical protein